MSSPLQTGVWLLRHLRPPFCTLAFSRPLRVKQFRSSPVPRRNVLATLSMLVLRRVVRERLRFARQSEGSLWDSSSPSMELRRPAPLPFGQVSQPLSLVPVYDASHTSSFRQPRSQD
jgi:hypothetical protein